jgi:hypothetical protein
VEIWNSGFWKGRGGIGGWDGVSWTSWFRAYRIALRCINESSCLNYDIPEVCAAPR